MRGTSIQLAMLGLPKTSTKMNKPGRPTSHNHTYNGPHGTKYHNRLHGFVSSQPHMHHTQLQKNFCYNLRAPTQHRQSPCWLRDGLPQRERPKVTLSRASTWPSKHTEPKSGNRLLTHLRSVLLWPLLLTLQYSSDGS